MEGVQLAWAAEGGPCSSEQGSPGGPAPIVRDPLAPSRVGVAGIRCPMQRQMRLSGDR